MILVVDAFHPGIVAAPGEGQVLDGARPLGRLQQFKGRCEYRALVLRVEGPACGVAQWEVEKYCSWGKRIFGDVAGAGQDHGGNTLGLQVPRDQTHGLVADRSHRRQQRNVHPLLPAAAQHFRSVQVAGLALAV